MEKIKVEEIKEIIEVDKNKPEQPPREKLLREMLIPLAALVLVFSLLIGNLRSFNIIMERAGDNNRYEENQHFAEREVRYAIQSELLSAIAVLSEEITFLEKAGLSGAGLDVIEVRIADEDGEQVVVQSERVAEDPEEEWLEEVWEVHHREEVLEVHHRDIHQVEHLSRMQSVHGFTFAAIYNRDQVAIVSGHDILDLLLESGGDFRSLSSEAIETLTQQFYEVIVVTFNEFGRWQVPFYLYSGDRNMFAANSDDFFNHPRRSRSPYHFQVSTYLNIENPAGMTFVFGVTHSMEAYFEARFQPHEQDNFWNLQWSLRGAVDDNLLFASGVMLLFAVAVPFKQVKETWLHLKAKGFFIEAIAVALVILRALSRGTRNHAATFIMQGYQNAPGSGARFMSYAWHLALSFGFFVVLGLGISYLKCVLNEGIDTLKNRSFIYHIYKRPMKGRLMSRLRLKLIGLIFLNLIILFLVTSLSFTLEVGWSLVFAYLIIVMIILYKKMGDIENNHDKLLRITKALSEGDIYVDLEENLGLFNPLRDEISQIKKGFTKAIEKAVKGERLKGDLITNVSHDLKTPLTSIVTYVDLLQTEGITDEKRSAYLSTLSGKTDRLRILIDDLFEASKATSGNLDLNLESVDIVTLMRQTLEGVADHVQDSGLRLLEDYPEGKVMVNVDGSRIHRVFENLILNMTKYSLEGTRAYIEIEELVDGVRVELKNISKHEISDVEGIGERFVRGDTSRSSDGSGLGLSIAQGIVLAHGGEFDIVVDGDLFKVVMTFRRG